MEEELFASQVFLPHNSGIILWTSEYEGAFIIIMVEIVKLLDITKRKQIRRKPATWQVLTTQARIALLIAFVVAVSILTVEVGTGNAEINGFVPLSFVENNLELAAGCEFSIVLFSDQSISWQLEFEESKLTFRLPLVSPNTYRGPPNDHPCN
jgi:hypothetical protein